MLWLKVKQHVHLFTWHVSCHFKCQRKRFLGLDITNLAGMQYSQPCLKRPLKELKNCGLLRQVII